MADLIEIELEDGTCIRKASNNLDALTGVLASQLSAHRPGYFGVGDYVRDPFDDGKNQCVVLRKIVGIRLVEGHEVSGDPLLVGEDAHQ